MKPNTISMTVNELTIIGQLTSDSSSSQVQDNDKSNCISSDSITECSCEQSAPSSIHKATSTLLFSLAVFKESFKIKTPPIYKID